MTWESFYFVCFLVGLFLSAFSLLGCMGHFGGHVHLPHAPHAVHLHGAGHLSHGSSGVRAGRQRPAFPGGIPFRS
jgi:hypothetical protein